MRGWSGRLSLSFLFQKLASGLGKDMDRHGDTIVTIVEVIKMMDRSLLYLKVLTVVSKCPDIRDDHISMLRAMPGDTRQDMKQTLIETGTGSDAGKSKQCAHLQANQF